MDLTGEKTKFKKRYEQVTPAMKIGLTSSQLDWRFLLVAPVPKNDLTDEDTSTSLQGLPIFSW